MTVSSPSVRSLLVPIVLAVAAVATVVLGAWFVAQPSARDHFFQPEAFAPITLMPARASGAVLVLTGILGLVAVLAMVTGGARRVAVAAGIAEMLIYALVLCGSGLVMLLGYLLAGLVPIGVVVVLILACRRYLVMRYLSVVIIGAVAVWGYLTHTMAPAGIAHLLGQIARAMLDQGLLISTMLVCVALATSWALRVRSLISHSTGLDILADRVRRHRRVFTFIAAACPLPYVLMRATWLTPWSQFTPAPMEPELRLWGLLLGGAALLGGILTLGLIRPWGVTFPRWIPVVGSHPVPPKVAVIPGLGVATVMTTAAIPMILMALQDAMPVHAALILTLGVFPFWLWGPSLALAVWGYAADRRVGAATAGPLVRVG